MLRQKRLMTLIHLFLVHRYASDSVHYVTPNEENRYQAGKMMSHGLFADVKTEVGDIIVADVNHARIRELLSPDRATLGQFIRKEGDFQSTGARSRTSTTSSTP
jgi:isocitrate lyase